MYRPMMMFFCLSLLILAGCSKAGPATPEDLSTRTLQLVATTGMVADAVRNVGGDRVKVDALMGPGVDPHLYKASEGDVSRMTGADAIFYNGIHLEGKITEVFAQMKKRGVTTVAVAEGIEAGRLLQPDEFEGAKDPHVWFDVSLWMKAVENVRDQLIRLDPAHEETYKSNGAAYLEKLTELHAYVKEEAANIPEAKRVLITAHDAFNYFGKAYGFEVRGLQGISTSSEAGTADVQALSSFIADRKIPAVFVESSVPKRSIEAVQAAVKAKGFEVAIGGELFSDAMGDAGTEEGTYLGMVRHNIDTIVKGLTGK